MSRYDIAIIGMGCNFPRAETVEKYWRNIKSGDSFFTKMPKRLWRLDNFYSKNRVKREKSYTTIGAFIDAFEFPFRKYRLPPNTMKGMDPAQLVSIQATEQALADAGIEPRSEALDDAVTIIGASGVDGFAHTSTFLRRHRFFDHLRPKLERSGAPASLIARLEEEFNQELQERGHTWDPANAAVGNVPSSISNRVAQVFGIRGFNMTVDAACASSMVALDVACQALCAGDTRLAVAGGCDLGTNPGIYVGFSQMEGLSISGHSNPFDHTADGLVIGEGVGVMVLKRLEDALSDGDQVRAVIRGVGASSDGAGQAIYAPSVKGRVKSFKTALDNARTHPSEVQYLEAHATSTIVGDAVEYDAISETYGHDRQGNAPLLIGSVKQQIGHLKAAAGMAGLIKTVLAMENGAFPHMPRFSKLTPEAQNPTANIQVPTRVMRWEPHANGLRVAAVTASGFGGVNYHAILEQGDQYQPPPERKTVPRDIAVVAMVCRLPGADTVDGFWDNVTHERDKFWPVDARKIGWHDHLDAGPENERITTRVIGKLDDWDFNFLKHKIFPKSISQIAATQFLALDLGERLLAQGGLDLASPKSIGVSVGTMHDDYYPTLCSPMFDQEYSDAIRCCPSAPQLDAERLDQALLAAAEQFKSEDPPITEHTLPGWMTNVTAGRMANKLNLHGPNFTVDSACSSGLAALLPAMYQLMFGNVDMMISGGLNRQLSAEFTVGVCTLGAVAEEIPRPFDERGQGFLIGEGGVQYLLKRLSDAQRDGDEIIAVLRSVHGSSEADSKSMVAPSEPAVRRAIRNALARTPVQPQDIRVVDVHGSANPVSDIVEARSLAAELRADGPGPGPVHITAIKSHVGHLYGGSGASSMLSTIMALRSGMAPGIRNLERLRPELQDIDDRAQPRKGSRSINGAKAGGVNSLGLGGANYFAVLSLPEANAQATSESSQTPEAEIPMPQPNPTGPQPVAEATGGHAAGIFLCSADGPQQLLASLRRALQQSPMASVIRAGGTGSLRLAASYQDKPELKRRVEAVVRMLDGGHDLSPLESQGVFVAERLPGEAPRKLAFCFPGQGVHYISMGRHLYDSNAVFRDAVDQVDALAREAFGFDLLAHIYGPEGDPGIEQALGTLVGAQTSLFAIEVGLARMLESMGVAPDVMIGHSFGEISALTAAGVWDLQTAYKVVEERIRAARAINTGGGPALGMMSLICAEAQRDSLLALAGGAVLLTNVNAPGRYVLAGELQAVKRTVEGAQAFGADATLLPIGGAFHSRYMEPAREPFRRALEGLPCSPPRYSILSTVTGEHIDATSVTSSWLAEHLSKQFVTPIDLVRDVGRLHREGVRHFLEVGPRWAMTKMVGGVLEGKQFRAAYCLHPKVGDEETFRRAKAFLMALGHLDPDGQHEAPQQDGRGRAFASLLSPSFLGYLGSSEPAVVALLKEAYLRFEQSGTPELPSEPPPAPPAPVRPPPAPVVAASPAAAPVPPQPEPAAPTPAAPSAAPEDLSVWIARLRQKLVDITGYPADMLEEQLDLEADLGVDSVQRAEIWTSLLNEHGLDATSRPSGPRTIANLAQALLELVPTEPAPPSSEPVAPPIPAPPPPPPDPADLVEPEGLAASPTIVPLAELAEATPQDAWEERLRHSLAEATGYPQEMLESHLDLEADLGIDSVQRAEIWSSLLAERGLDPKARPSGPRTIRNLALCLAQLSEGDDPGPAPERAPTPEPAPPPEPTPTPRPDPVDELRSEPAVALEQALPTEDQAPTGEACALMVSASATLPKRDLAPFACRSVLAITAELGNCPVAKRLRGCGVDVLSLRASSVASMGEEELEQAMQGRDTLLYLAHRRLAALKPDGESLSAALSEQTRLLYGAFRALWPLLQRKGLRIMVPVSQDGAFGASLRTPAGLLGSFPAGFVRCLRHELPDCVIQLIDAGEIPWEDAVERRLDTVSDELEVGRSSFRDLRATLAPLGATSVRPDVLTPGDLVLVTGGARGIVFECVLALAKITGVRLLLTGRTALPQDRPDWLSASPATVDATIRALEIDLVRNRGMGLGEAKRVGARARSQWELTRNLQRLAAAGVEARYEVCDVSDTASFSTLLGRIAQADTVRGVVHGAGIQRSHLLDELDDETVDLTIRTKLAPFFAMLDSLDWSQLRLFSAFGSIAGLFGNAGQTDYALANDQLCWAVRWLRQRYPHLRAQTIEWTAWTGTGMVSAEESKRFAEAGLTPLTVRAGVKLFLEGLLGSDHTQLAAFNPSAAFAGGRPMARFPVAAQPLKRLVEFPEGRSPSVRLDLSRDLYLEQHLVQGQPVAPGTFVANIFAEVAQRDGETVRDVRFRRPLSVRQAGLDLEVLRLGDQLALLPGERPALDDKAILNLAYSTCRVVPQEELTPPPLSFTARDLLALHGAAQDAETPFYELLDREFRHALDTGPIFRGIRSTRHQDECFLSLVSLGDEAAALLAIPGEFVFNPVLADMAVQTGCAWAMITHRVMAIPWELGGVEVHGETQDREAVVICRAIQLSPKQSVLDITVREPDGRPVFQLDRLVLKTIAEQGVGPDDET